MLLKIINFAVGPIIRLTKLSFQSLLTACRVPLYFWSEPNVWEGLSGHVESIITFVSSM